MHPPADYLIGAGIYDITGPPAEIVMMGYAVPTQKTSGIHLRLRSRAFIVGDAESGESCSFAPSSACCFRW